MVVDILQLMVVAGRPLVVLLLLQFVVEDNLVVLDTLMVDTWRLMVGMLSAVDMWR